MEKNNNNPPDKNRPPQNGGKDEPIERLIESLENEIASIETQEIIKGLTSDELEEKGFIGDKIVTIERSGFTHSRELTGFIFEDAVEYVAKNGLKNIADIDFSELIFLKDVLPGQVLAYRKLPKATNEAEYGATLKLYNDEYLKKANVRMKRDGDRLQFVAEVKGKAVCTDEFLYVVQSDRNAQCKVRVTVDKMLALADFVPAYGSGKALEKKDVVLQLEALGIAAGILETKIEEYVATLKSEEKPLYDVVVAQGKQPVDAKPAEPIFFFSVDSTIEDFKILPDGRIDYHKRANIQIVKKGSVLAKNAEPQKGEDGVDVLGAALKPKEAEAVRLLPGENVSESKDGMELIAESDGQASVNGSVVSVFENYLVNGDVDFSVGNIDFNGNVTVKGMVLSGFEVKATGDIIVLKGVESAYVKAGRDVKVYGGIIGGGANHLVCCGRNLNANHLQNARIEAQGDVCIANSCVQSSVFCNGKVVLPNRKGAIIGGSVNAFGGVEARTLGTEFGTKTEIIVGKDFLAQKTIDEFNKAINFQYVNMQKIDKVLLPLLELVKKGMPLSGEKKVKLKMITDKRLQIKKSIAIMEKKRDEIEKQIPANAEVTVKVSGKVYSDTTVRIKDYVKQIRDPIEHITIYYDKKKNEIALGPF